MFNMAGAVFFMCTVLFTGNLFNIILIFQHERPVFLREQANNMYSVKAYFLAKQFLELPAALLVPTFMMLMVYWTIGYNNANNPEEIFQLVLIGFLLINVAIGYGYFISATFKSFEAAAGAAPLFLIPTMLFGGFFINSSSYPPVVGLLKYLTPMYFSNAAIMRANWHDGT